MGRGDLYASTLSHLPFFENNPSMKCRTLTLTALSIHYLIELLEDQGCKVKVAELLHQTLAEFEKECQIVS